MTKNESNDVYIDMCFALDPIYAGTADSVKLYDLTDVADTSAIITIASEIVYQMNHVLKPFEDEEELVALSMTDNVLFVTKYNKDEI